MAEIEVLLDFGRPYVRLDDYNEMKELYWSQVTKTQDADGEAAKWQEHARAALARAEAAEADNRRLAARVAELEAQLAAQQWRPVTEEPIEDEYYLTYDALLPGNEPWIVNYYSRTQGWANCCSAWLCPPPKPPRPTGDGVTPSK